MDGELGFLSNIITGVQSIWTKLFDYGMSHIDKKDSQTYNSEEAQKARDFTTSEREAQQEYQTSEREAAQNWQAEQYAKRYQTQVEDMRAAGLNPALASGMSAGTLSSTGGSAPSGSSGAQASAGNAINPGSLDILTSVLATKELESKLEAQGYLNKQVQTDTEGSSLDNYIKQIEAQQKEQELTLKRSNILADINLKEKEGNLTVEQANKLRQQIKFIEENYHDIPSGKVPDLVIAGEIGAKNAVDIKESKKEIKQHQKEAEKQKISDIAYGNPKDFNMSSEMESERNAYNIARKSSPGTTFKRDGHLYVVGKNYFEKWVKGEDGQWLYLNTFKFKDYEKLNKK